MNYKEQIKQVEEEAANKIKEIKKQYYNSLIVQLTEDQYKFLTEKMYPNGPQSENFYYDNVIRQLENTIKKNHDNN
jgi:formyltetrahydrofolate synthetase